MEEDKYKAALERAKSAIKECGNNLGRIKMIESIFPELKESEDERIRKDITILVNDWWDRVATNNMSSRGEMLAWLEKQGKPEDIGEVSDGYHTFNELYYYRMLYNAAFFNRLPKDWVHKSKRHHDGEECFGGGWFIVMANLPTGQISNHYELKDWDLFQIPEKDIADEWDGHTPQEAAERLHKFLLEKQGEQKPADKVEPEQKEEIADRNMETTEENEGKRLYYTLNWVIGIYGQLDEKTKKEAEELFPELKEISTLSPFERKLMELCNFCAHKGKILTAASARYAAKSFLPLAMEHKKAMEDKK